MTEERIRKRCQVGAWMEAAMNDAAPGDLDDGRRLDLEIERRRGVNLPPCVRGPGGGRAGGPPLSIEIRVDEENCRDAPPFPLLTSPSSISWHTFRENGVKGPSPWAVTGIKDDFGANEEELELGAPDKAVRELETGGEERDGAENEEGDTNNEENETEHETRGAPSAKEAANEVGNAPRGPKKEGGAFGQMLQRRIGRRKEDAGSSLFASATAPATNRCQKRRGIRMSGFKRHALGIARCLQKSKDASSGAPVAEPASDGPRPRPLAAIAEDGNEEEAPSTPVKPSIVNSAPRETNIEECDDPAACETPTTVASDSTLEPPAPNSSEPSSGSAPEMDDDASSGAGRLEGPGVERPPSTVREAGRRDVDVGQIRSSYGKSSALAELLAAVA